jgi:hypothetical protein
MKQEITMHVARMAMNRDDEIRAWCEAWMKAKEHEAHPEMSKEELAKHWLYVRPERMHEGAVEAVSAYYSQHENSAA